MEKLCQEIAISHEQRRMLLKELKSSALRLREETTQYLEGFQKQFDTFRGDFQAARRAWRKSAAVLSRKRRRSR